MTDKEKFEAEKRFFTKIWKEWFGDDDNPGLEIVLAGHDYIFESMRKYAESLIKQKEIDARIKQLEDAKAYTESKLGCGYNSFTEEVLAEMAEQYQHLISELQKEKGK